MFVKYKNLFYRAIDFDASVENALSVQNLNPESRSELDIKKLLKKQIK